MKTKRNLSGIYCRYKNLETGKFDNVCFEDLPEDEQDKFMKNRNEEFLKNLSKRLADVLNEVGEYTGIAKE